MAHFIPCNKTDDPHILAEIFKNSIARIKKNEARIVTEARTKSWTKLTIFIHFVYRVSPSQLVDH
ncbi:hypothetical protein EPI10_001227 [Gossypium australe]|uniref:Uncharacterized protein n=1 Tax=Gossypium australe TaxID=47621 RepID=A0A5B6VA91_9ROSI|nr:hypothetical protein EPI10_001227 [Gossypium australe]